MLKIDSMLTNPYSDSSKIAMHSRARSFLKDLAEELCLPEGSYSVRSKKAGPAVSGEVTLHGDNLYVKILAYGSKLQAMYRSCKSQKDYCGGQNNWVDLPDLAEADRMWRFVMACKTLNDFSMKKNLENQVKAEQPAKPSADEDNAAFGMR